MFEFLAETGPFWELATAMLNVVEPAADARRASLHAPRRDVHVSSASRPGADAPDNDPERQMTVKCSRG